MASAQDTTALFAEEVQAGTAELVHQFQCGVLVSLGLDQHIEDLAFGVNRPPEIDHSAVDFQIDLCRGSTPAGPICP